MQIGASKDLTTSLALLCYNWHPSSVFIGDMYTYFVGMTMAIVSILGHFSETLLISFTPQPAGMILCPRHHFPKFNPNTGLLTGTNDGTLVNFTLRLVGRIQEESLCIALLLVQAIASRRYIDHKVKVMGGTSTEAYLQKLDKAIEDNHVYHTSKFAEYGEVQKDSKNIGLNIEENNRVLQQLGIPPITTTLGGNNDLA
ncbi:hypothetical protein Cgig2_012967 [Carnegiea gigantea]|uniref:UDP-N-acetylglucosamine--dolichyl-phosphate N-acetylglucosaminephosphotransferase n=1 Tax=Carnegiea gigantea TaxID=171969 RepID=A0A9Q1QB43_9CARY|nr:hypothetical protein Cgig2_012967 [Carnegiea gigantea]